MFNFLMPKAPRDKLRVGVVANEFFDLSLGRMGGFGILTRQVAECFRDDPDLGVEVVFLSGEHDLPEGKTQLDVNGTPLIPIRSRNESPARGRARVKAENIDVFFTICYRSNFRRLFRVLPRTPIIVWIQDPRTPVDVEAIRNIRVPDRPDVQPPGLDTPDCTSMNEVVKSARWTRRRIVYGTPAQFLPEKAWQAYGTDPAPTTFLPYMVEFDPGPVRKHETPRVIFLGRLDPYKRPWLYAELARKFPHVEFVVMGKGHFDTPDAGVPEEWPDNVRLTGHVDGDEKIRLINSAWALINTSHHEGLPVSFVEALKCETPILSSVNPEDVVSRFGIFVGRYPGTGREALPGFVEGLTRLVEDEELRRKLGRAGREWAEMTHCKPRFLEGFRTLTDQAGLRVRGLHD